MSRSDRPSYEDGTAILFSEATSIVGGVCAVLFSILGTVGNLVTILALSRSALRTHPTTMCLISLAISDLIFSAYNLPLQAHRFFHRGCEFMCLDWHMCKYYPFFFYGNLGVSVLVMALIAIHRVFGVFYGHLLDRVFNQVTILIMILGAWVLAFGTMYFPLTNTWGQLGYEPQIFSCTFVESEGETFMPFMTTVGIGIPLAIISTSYLAIYCKVKTTGRATRRAAKGRNGSSDVFGPHTMAAQTKERERSITITFSLIFISFVICFLPYGFIMVVDPMPPSKLGWLHMITYILSWTSAFVNPVIYCLANKYYLETFKQLFKQLLKSSKPREALESSGSAVSRETEETVQELLKNSLRQTTSFSSRGIKGDLTKIDDI
jgi:hypothetical protein